MCDSAETTVDSKSSAKPFVSGTVPKNQAFSWISNWESFKPNPYLPNSFYFDADHLSEVLNPQKGKGPKADAIVAFPGWDPKTNQMYFFYAGAVSIGKSRGDLELIDDGNDVCMATPSVLNLNGTTPIHNSFRTVPILPPKSEILALYNAWKTLISTNSFLNFGLPEWTFKYELIDYIVLTAEELSEAISSVSANLIRMYLAFKPVETYPNTFAMDTLFIGERTNISIENPLSSFSPIKDLGCPCSVFPWCCLPNGGLEAQLAK